MILIYITTMFVFKHFTINDQNSAMKVGTDGVLLGAWSQLPYKAERMLDVGCGSGILSLIMAQRSNGCLQIDAIDIDEGAIKDAKDNFLSTAWNKTLNVINGNFVSYSENSQNRYDMVISNPPFFTEDTLSPDMQRAFARNTSSLSFDNLFKGVAKVISLDGIFAMIAPAESYSYIALTALLNGFYLSRLTWVVTVEGSEPKRVMTEWGRKQVQYSIDTLIMTTKEGSYTSQYKELTDEFYL